MDYFPQDLKDYIKTYITNLSADYPNTYQFPSDMLANMKVDFEPENADSYIACLNINEQRQETFTTYLYTINTKIVMKGTENIGMNVFSYICKGINDAIQLLINNTVGNFKITRINILPYTINRAYNKSYQCEIIADYYVDVVTIPDDFILNS